MMIVLAPRKPSSRVGGFDQMGCLFLVSFLFCLAQTAYYVHRLRRDTADVVSYLTCPPSL